MRMWQPGRLAAALLVATMPALAQMHLSIDSVDAAAFPTVNLRITTSQGALLRRDLAASNYALRENGFAQAPLTLTCDEGTQPFSVVFVIGSGSSMSAGDVAFAKGVAERVVNALDGLNDEAGVVTYSASAAEIQGLTSAKSQLINAIGNISASAQANKFWEGVYQGIQTAAGSSNPRAILVLSNGIDDGSLVTLAQVAQAANTSSCRMVVLGVNPGSGASNLQDLANATNGQYFTDADLAVQSLVNGMRGTPAWCTLSFVSDDRCRDGSLRTLDLAVTDGALNAAASDSYTPSADPATNATVAIDVDTAGAKSGSPVTLAIRVATVLPSQAFHPVTATLAFDTSLLKLTAARADTDRLPGVVAAGTPTATGADLSLQHAAILRDTGRIVTLELVAANVTQNADVPVKITAWTFSDGCLTAATGTGRVTIRPKNYALRGAAQPLVFMWSDAAHDYTPSPGDLPIAVDNIGDLPVSGLTAEFPAQEDVRFAPGWGPTVPVAPSALDPGSPGTATFRLRALPRRRDTTLNMALRIHAAEGVEVTVHAFINIRAATSAVTVRGYADTVRYSGGAYAPDPASVRAIVTSAGMNDGPAGDVRILLPPELTLDGGTDTQSFAAMPSGDADTLAWSVRYPTDRQTAETYPIRFALLGTGQPPDTVSVDFPVPAPSGAALATACAVASSPVAYDTIRHGYNLVEVHAHVRNDGVSPSDTVRVGLSVTSPLMFLGGEIPEKALTPSLAPGDTIEAVWYLMVEDVTCDSVRTGTFHYRLRSEGATLFECVGSVDILGRPNLLPEVQAVVPARLDSVALGSSVDFSVTAVDPNGDAIAASWYADDTLAASGTLAFTHRFDALGTSNVRCVLRDFCAADSVVVSWPGIVVYRTTAAADVSRPEDFLVAAASPNPFSGETTVTYRLSGGARRVSIRVVDARGATVRVLAGGDVGGGVHTVRFDGADLPNGTYWIVLRANGAERSLPVVRIR